MFFVVFPSPGYSQAFFIRNKRDMINIQLKILQMKKAPRRGEGDEAGFRRPYDFRSQLYIYILLDIVSYLHIYI